jgi:hypothetical protein
LTQALVRCVVACHCFTGIAACNVSLCILWRSAVSLNIPPCLSLLLVEGNKVCRLCWELQATRRRNVSYPRYVQSSHFVRMMLATSRWFADVYWLSHLQLESKCAVTQEWVLSFAFYLSCCVLFCCPLTNSLLGSFSKGWKLQCQKEHC